MGSMSNGDEQSSVDLTEAQVARQIRVELAARAMEQGDLADRAGMARSTLSRYLQGHRSMTMTTFFSIAAALDTKPSDLLARASKLDV
jgi:transcriptional regulator with XRE-family HTH domain